MIDLCKLIGYASGTEPQISGGLGLSIDDPIIVLENHHGMAIELERFVAKELSVFYGMWKANIEKTTLLESEGRTLDELQIVHENTAGDTVESKLYFDITKAYKSIGKTLESVKSESQLESLRADEYFKRIEPTPHFYAAAYYAFTLEKNEHLNAESLMNALAIESAQVAEDLTIKLQRCGFNTR